MATNDMNDDEVLAEAEKIRQRRANEARAATQARFAPLVALTTSEAFQTVRAAIRVAIDEMAAVPSATGILRTTANMMEMVAAQIPVDARPAAGN